MEIMIKTKWDVLFETIIDGILAFKDYFLIKKHITLGEATIFSLSLGRALWFTAFGVNIGPTPGPLSHEAWTPFFWLLTLAHFATFFLPNLIYRIGVLCAYAVVWCFLAMLVAVSTFNSPALPTFLIFSLLSVILAVRLIRDWKT